jgi:uncharacterized protein
MKISFDPEKRDRTLAERGLDFADAGAVFEDFNYTRVDDRHDYGETRYITVGALLGRVVVMVWTHRENSRRVISMRFANGREKKIFLRHRAGDLGLD